MEGPLRITRDAEPFRPRTRHQGLLLARLAVHGEQGIDRWETAAMLWPEAERSRQATYLRRALMELRRAGFEIESQDGRLRPTGSVECAPLGEGAILAGVEHPIAYEIRTMVRHERSVAATQTVVQGEEERIWGWLGGTLLRTRPDVALDVLAEHGIDLVRRMPSDSFLSLLLKALAAQPRITAPRIDVCRVAAHTAILLTKYGLAERLLRESGEECRVLGDEGRRAKALSMLAYMQMELRRWSEAIESSERAAEAADASGDSGAIAVARSNLGGIQLNRLLLDEAAANFAIAYAASADEVQKTVILGNAALIWGVFGRPIWKPIETSDFPDATQAATVSAGTFMRIGYGIRHAAADVSGEGAIQLLQVTGSGGLDRLFCIAVDMAAIAFAQNGRPQDAAACVRVGSRFRLCVGHRRSPAEKLGMRLYAKSPYFGEAVNEVVREIASDEAAVSGRRIAARLDALLSGHRTPSSM